MEKELLDMATQVTQGNANALEIYVKFKAIDKVLQDCIKSVQPEAIAEAHKYSEKTFEAYGAHIEKKAGAGKWDYKHISKWSEEKENLKHIEEMAQIAFKSMQHGTQYFDDKGEQVEPASYTSGSDTIAISFIKNK